MKPFMVVAWMLVVMLMISACEPQGTGETTADPGETSEAPTKAPENETETQEEDGIDRETILEMIHTIPKVMPFSSGYKTIGFTQNSLLNGDFKSEQAPWQINSLDGVVIDNGLMIKEQAADIQQVILAQGVKGFEKMKSYRVNLEASVEGEVPVTVNLRHLENHSVLASVEMLTHSETMTYHGDFALDYDLHEGAVFELVIETQKEDGFHLKHIELVRKPLELIWSDEFETDGLPDPEKWTYDEGGNGWGNGELQYYTTADGGNAIVKDGVLILTAIEENIQLNPYTSARMVNRESYATKYKRIEVRAKLPDGIGTWPAIWMLPSDNTYGGWPSSGEIDIMEHVGYDQDIIHGTIHTGDYNHRQNTQKSGKIYVPESNDGFYTYTLDWTPYELDFYVDDYLYFTFDNEGAGPDSWPFDQEFYMILNIAVGGEWGGAYGIDPEAFPASMEIDYVRYFDLPVESKDVEPPSAVKDIRVEVNGTSATYTWPPAMDDYLVDYYEIYLDDVRIARTNERTYTLEGLDENTSYAAGIVAVDESGNTSDLITSAFVTKTGNTQGNDGSN